MSLLDRLRDELKGGGVLPEGARILVAVSGGADSTALLLLLHQLKDEFGFKLSVGHVDHGIRPDSAKVATNVTALVSDLAIPFRIAVLQLGSAASETVAREARYDRLFAIRDDLKADFIATAHHADDQIETVLFRALKGSGMLGLAGIKSSRMDGLTRPLLGFRRSEIRKWLANQKGAPEVDVDPANVEMRHDRAWLRGELLPVLRRRFGGSVEENLLRLGNHAASDQAAWSGVVRALPGLDWTRGEAWAEVAREGLLEYDKPLSLAILRAVSHDLGCVLGPSKADLLFDFLGRSTSGRQFEIGQGWVGEIVFDRVRIRRLSGAVDVPAAAVWGEGEDGCIEWGVWSIRWSADSAGQNTRESSTTWVTRGGGAGEVRAVKPGDRIRPLGGAGSRRVVRELMEGRIPRSERDGFPVLVRDDEVLWLPGICRSMEAQPEPGTAAIRLDVNNQPV